MYKRLKFLILEGLSTPTKRYKKLRTYLDKLQQKIHKRYGDLDQNVADDPHYGREGLKAFFKAVPKSKPVEHTRKHPKKIRLVGDDKLKHKPKIHPRNREVRKDINAMEDWHARGSSLANRAKLRIPQSIVRRVTRSSDNYRRHDYARLEKLNTPKEHR